MNIKNEEVCMDKAIEKLKQFLAPRFFTLLADEQIILNILYDLYEDGYEAGYKDGQGWGNGK